MHAHTHTLSRVQAHPNCTYAHRHTDIRTQMHIHARSKRQRVSARMRTTACSKGPVRQFRFCAYADVGDATECVAGADAGSGPVPCQRHWPASGAYSHPPGTGRLMPQLPPCVFPFASPQILCSLWCLCCHTPVLWSGAAATARPKRPSAGETRLWWSSASSSSSSSSIPALPCAPARAGALCGSHQGQQAPAALFRVTTGVLSLSTTWSALAATALASSAAASKLLRERALACRPTYHSHPQRCNLTNPAPHACAVHGCSPAWPCVAALDSGLELVRDPQVLGQ